MPVGCELHDQQWVQENGSGVAEQKLFFPKGTLRESAQWACNQRLYTGEPNAYEEWVLPITLWSEVLFVHSLYKN